MSGAKKTSTKTVKPRPADDDPRVAALLRTLASDRALGPVVRAFEARKEEAGGRKFGSNGLKVNGKLFALFTQGTLVVKLPRDRVEELVAENVGVGFDPGHGRVMKEWLTVTSAKAEWGRMVREAYAFVKAGT